MNISEIFDESGSFTLEPLDQAESNAYVPEDVLVFETDIDDVKPLRPDMCVAVEIVTMLKEAKERHLPVMFTNNDETRAILIKDANDLNTKITVNGVPFEEI